MTRPVPGLQADLQELSTSVRPSTLTASRALLSMLTGTSGNDSLPGTTGDDTLDGGAGADTLAGGKGNDTYIVDNAGDVVQENSASGTDTVQSSVSWTLGNNLENLVLTGLSKLNGTGNTLDNVLTGNGGDNVLSGLDGNDTLFGQDGNDTLDGGLGSDQLVGGLGNDSYVVDASKDKVVELAGQGKDTVLASIKYTLGADLENLTLTGSANLNGTGNELDNVLTGNAGANVLDGQGGKDTLAGGAGNDTYVIDSSTDTLIELTGEGTDTVKSSVTYTLADNIENLILTGTANINATGNALNNRITGNSGANVMAGGLGSDVYEVDHVGDVVIEASTAGADTINSSLSWTLGANIERLTLTGTASNSATGNTLHNILTGNSGDNLLTGLSGNDTLVGGGGNDTLDGGSGNDSLTGGSGSDTYYVDSATDVLVELASEGNDTVISSTSFSLADNFENLTLTGSADLNGTGNGAGNVMTGNAGNNALSGGDGSDQLDGGAGFDTLTGGLGNDTFVVDSSADVVIEAVGEGNDLVLASASFTLSDNIEDITLTGTANINATGNALGNKITGNSGANVLAGGAGSDTYFVDNAGDVIVEASGNGTDTVNSSISWTLADNVERLTLSGSAHLNGTGNTLNNILTGNAGDNVLQGLSGNDTLNGNGGIDTLDAGSGNDTLTLGTAALVGQGSVDGGTGSDTLTISLLAQNARWYGLDAKGAAIGHVDADSSRADVSSLLAGSVSLKVFGNTNGESLTLSNLENLNVTAGSAGDDLVIAMGSGSLSGGAGTDAVYADWSTAVTDISWNVSVGNGLSTSGFERFLLATGSGNDTLTLGAVGQAAQGDVDGGAGIDTVTINQLALNTRWYGLDAGGNTLGQVSVNSSSAAVAALIASSTSLKAYGSTNGESLALSHIENLNVTTGSSGDDLVLAMGTGTLNGGAGNDALYADWSSAATAITWDGLAGNGVTSTGFERFLLTTGSGADSITIGSAGLAAQGDVDGGAGKDTVTIVQLAQDTRWYGLDSSGTSLGFVTADSSRATVASLIASSSALKAYGFTNGEALSLKNVENLNISTGSSGDDLVIAMGTGTLDGGAGTDTLYTDWSSATSNVTWNGSAGKGLSTSGFERFLISTGSGDDSITVGRGNQVSQGDIDGGAGTDTVIINQLAQNTRWYGMDASGANIGLVTSNSSSAAITSLVSASVSLKANGTTHGETLVLSGIENLSVLTGSSEDDLVIAMGTGSLNGGAGSDTLYANWSAASGNINWNGSAGNGVTSTGFERFLLLSGSGNDVLDQSPSGVQADDDFNAGAGNDTLNGGLGSDLLTGGTGADTFAFTSLIGSDTVTDFLKGTDKISLSRTSLPVGDADGTVEGGIVVAGHGGFGSSAELVICTTDIVGNLGAGAAAAMIGSASGSYTTGQTALFVVDNGTDSAVYYFKSSGNDAVVSASELTLLATLSGTASTTLGDFVFGA